MPTVSCTGSPNAVRYINLFHVVGQGNEVPGCARLATAGKAAKREHGKLRAKFGRRSGGEGGRGEGSGRARVDASAGTSEQEEARAAGIRDRAGWNARGGRREGEAVLLPEHRAVLDGLERTARAVKGARHALGHAHRERDD